ncbi:5-oxoprolinase subunit B family protein [Nocardioides donggukensis]|uniref:Allophanate hydrolase subunit 1 n=1 Tax=Nocardioides donggukensis TaxID=2774019 RepID=A0A927PZ73_9ACTN|nr:allophanate hydrolase subunit 1 [Nocardioides donggukensis]MBD8869668.1 allophanate hydrolase subunit 1 [Nocardioides donggukensis]
MQVIPVGPEAALVEVGEADAALGLALWARGRVPATEIVPAARTVLFDGLADPVALAGQLADWPGEAPTPEGEVVEVPVLYDGPDLATVAETWGLDGPDQVAGRHTEQEHLVAFCGFAPGFSYLTGHPALPEVPRRDTPRARVAPGSVALAGPFTGIYPSASPGGWQIVGRTEATLWDPTREPAALLPPGTRVRFVAA